MFFSSPLWLFTLLPWTGIALVLLRGRRHRVAVPFVQLWKGPVDGPRSKASLAPPPGWIVFTLLALLFAVLAAARPTAGVDRTAEKPEANGLLTAAARAEPKAEVMIRLAASASARTVHVTSGTNHADQTVAPSTQESTAFIDLPKLDRDVLVEVGNETLHLRASPSGAKVIDNPRLPESLRRMIDVYNRHRSPADPNTIDVVTDADQLPDDRSAVLLETSANAVSEARNQVADHPLTRHVHFSNTLGSHFPSGYEAIVSNQTGALVAIRNENHRQVWVCLNDREWAATPDYVIFWTNVFDWLGGDVSTYEQLPTMKGLSTPPAQRDLTPIACIVAVALMLGAIVARQLKFHLVQPRTIDSIT